MVVKATHKAFTPAYRIALRDELSLGQYRMALLKQRAGAFEVTARKVARQAFHCVRRQIELGELTRSTIQDPAFSKLILEPLVRRYGCKAELVEYAIGCVQQLIDNARRNGRAL